MLRLYWAPRWITDANYRATVNEQMSEASLAMSNARFEHLLNEAYTNGATDAKERQHREGILIFGRALKETFESWPPPGSDPDPSFPRHMLTRLLDDWNIT